jgi:catechol 2,3-dioxygenase-like lactoylglutathione lyase family enzyme
MPVLSVLHCCVNVPDMEEALVFFRDLLGFDLLMRGMHSDEQIGPLLRMEDTEALVAIIGCPDGSEIELIEFRRPRGEIRCKRQFEDVGISVLTLIVDDVETVSKKLSRNGYPSWGDIVPFKGLERDLLAVHVQGPGGIPITLGEWRTHQPAGSE